MLRFILFTHLLASTAMGIYLLLPFLVGRLGGKPDAGMSGFAGLLVTANRIGQYLLIVQFLTGGYLISQGSYSHVWSAVISLLFIGIAALAGMMGKPLKRLRDNFQKGQNAGTDAAKVRNFGVIIGILYFAMLIMMKYPDLL
jgi:hypothetical protein